MINNQSASDFYDEISDFYDSMLDFDKRLERETEILKPWNEKYRFKRVLDAGCGTGVHSIALSELGIETAGTDISEKMLAKAQINALRRGQSISFYPYSFQQLDRLLPAQFDTILILGNSLAHILSPQKLREILAGCRNLLSINGRLIIQVINYARILKEKERIISITRRNRSEYIRFYDFEEPLIRFNVLSVHWKNDSASYSIAATDLYPFTSDELQKSLLETGFKICDQYGSMQLEPYHKANSQNYIVVSEVIKK